MTNSFMLLVIPEIINVLLVKGIILFYLYYCLRIINKEIRSSYFWAISILFLLLMRLSDFFTPFSMNPDEEQWLICANSLVESPSDWLQYFLIADYSRFFTFLPIALISFFTDGASYEFARFVNLSMLISILFFNFKTLEIFLPAKMAYITIAFLLIVFSSSSHYDLINYNSEMPVLLIVSITCFIYLSSTNRKISAFKYGILGFLTSMIPFAKEQAALIAISIFAFIFIDLILAKNYRQLISLIIGGLLLPSIFILILTANYSIYDFIDSLKTGIKYSDINSGLENNLDNKFAEIINKYLINFIRLKDFSIVYISVFVSIIAIAYFRFKKIIKLYKADYLMVFLMIISIYTIAGLKSPIYHYYLFIFIFAAWFIGRLFTINKEFLKISLRHSFLSISLLTLVSKSQSNIKLERRFYNDFSDFQTEDPEQIKQQNRISIIKKHNAFGKGTVIWGFGIQYYISCKLKRCNSSLYSQFALKKNYDNKKVIEKYLMDIDHFKPYSFIDIKNGYKYWRVTTEEQEIEYNSKDLFKYLSENYNLVESLDDFDLYIRKKQ